MKLGDQHQVPVGLPEGNSRYPSHRRLGGLQFSWAWENLPRPELELQTIQLVASRFTDNTIPTHTIHGLFWEECLTRKKLRNYVVFL
jgi:hypothetical protein